MHATLFFLFFTFPTNSCLQSSSSPFSSFSPFSVTDSDSTLGEGCLADRPLCDDRSDGFSEICLRTCCLSTSCLFTGCLVTGCLDTGLSRVSLNFGCLTDDGFVGDRLTEDCLVDGCFGASCLGVVCFLGSFFGACLGDCGMDGDAGLGDGATDYYYNEFSVPVITFLVNTFLLSVSIKPRSPRTSMIRPSHLKLSNMSIYCQYCYRGLISFLLPIAFCASSSVANNTVPCPLDRLS